MMDQETHFNFVKAMRTLYHYYLCPFSRKVRLALQEKKLDFDLQLEHPWEQRPAFLKLNPASQTPVLIDLNGHTICDSRVIVEYLEEVYPQTNLLGGSDPYQRSEVRRLMAWFDDRFAQEVWINVVVEKVLKRFFDSTQSPNSLAMRQGREALKEHMAYLSWIIDRRRWLGGETFSLADITAAAHLSTLDYLGEIPWQEDSPLKHWYARVKSRPSFRPLLQDYIPGVPPSKYYKDLDF